MAAGFAVQYGLAALASSGAGAPLFSTFNAAHFEVGYFHQGFIKRGLIGTLFTGFDSAARFTAVVAFNLLVLAGFAGLVAGVLAACRPRIEHHSFRLLAALWIVAPAGAINLGYDFARLDHVNFLLLGASLLALGHGRVAWAALFTVLALLIHEAFLFYGVPFLLAAVWRSGTASRRLVPMISLLGATVASSVLLWQWGRFEAGRAALVASADGRINPSHNVLNVWLRPLSANLRYVGERWAQGLFSLVELGLFAVFAASAMTLLIAVYRANRRPLDGLAATPLAVLPLFVLGIDYARWLALFWLVVVAIITHGVVTQRFTRLLGPTASRASVALLAAGLLLGPLGSVHLFPLMRYAFGI